MSDAVLYQQCCEQGINETSRILLAILLEAGDRFSLLIAMIHANKFEGLKTVNPAGNGNTIEVQRLR